MQRTSRRFACFVRIKSKRSCLSLAAVGAVERVGYAAFEGTKKSVQKSEPVVFCETQQFAVLVEHVSAICAQHLAVCFPFPPPSPPFPVLAFARWLKRRRIPERALMLRCG